MSDGKSRPKKRRKDPAGRSKLPKPRGTSLEDYIDWALLVCAQVVLEYAQVVTEPDRKPRSADDLHFVMRLLQQQARGTDIIVSYLYKGRTYRLKWLFLGVTIKGKKGTHILLNPYLNKQGQRFGLVQESFHALLDTKSIRAKKLAKSIDDYLVRVRCRDFSNALGSTYGEIIGEIAAMEALFPYADRLKYVTRLRALRAPKTTRDENRLIASIATKYGIPAQWVRFYLRDDIMDQLKPYHEGR